MGTGTLTVYDANPFYTKEKKVAKGVKVAKVVKAEEHRVVKMIEEMIDAIPSVNAHPSPNPTKSATAKASNNTTMLRDSRPNTNQSKLPTTPVLPCAPHISISAHTVNPTDIKVSHQMVTNVVHVGTPATPTLLVIPSAPPPPYEQ
jgi:hypothetical protein